MSVIKSIDSIESKLDDGQIKDALSILKTLHGLSLKTLEPRICHKFGRILFRLGLCFFENAAYQDAVRLFDQAHQCLPKQIEILEKIAICWQELYEYQRSLLAIQHALKIETGHAQLWNLLGRCYYRLCDYDKSAAAYQRAMQLAPRDPLIAFNYGILLLLRGQYNEGFKYYDARLDLKTIFRISDVIRNKINFKQDLTGKQVAILCEQGIGDTLQMIRFFPGLQQRFPAHYTLICDAKIKQLMEVGFKFDHVVAKTDTFTTAFLNQFDFIVPLMSLPRYFDLSEDFIRQTQGYLKCPSSLGDPNFLKQTKNKKIALCWQSQAKLHHVNLRNIPEEKILPLLQKQGVDFYAFNFESELSAQTAQYCQDVTANLDDFSDTLAYLKQMDLVITVDTALAHLAGAFQIPTWVLIRKVPAEWRWQTGREDTPWYDSVRLFRQQEFGHWDSVIAEVCIALEE